MYTYDDILLFTRIIDIGSFAGTAKILNITQSTVSRRIKMLEESLGIRLFQYEGKKAVPTVLGKQIYNKVNEYKRSFDEFDTFMDSLIQNKQTPKGELFIALPSISIYSITPYIMLFQKKYPNIVLNLIYTDTSYSIDLVKDDFDMMITNHVPDKTHFQSYKLTNLIAPNIGLYCTEGYIKRYGTPNHPRDLYQHTIVGYIRPDRVKTTLIEFKHLTTNEILVLNLNSNIFVNGSTNVLQLAYSNEAIIGMTSLNTAKDLVRVLPDYIINDAVNSFTDIYLIRHPFKENLANRLFSDYIKFLFKLHRENCIDIRNAIINYLESVCYI